MLLETIRRDSRSLLRALSSRAAVIKRYHHDPSPYTYEESHERSLNDPEGFWGEAAEKITWMKKPTRILDRKSGPLYKWFTDGTMNTSYNCLDRHIEGGHGALPAIHYHSAITGEKELVTYEDLLDRVSKAARALSDMGVGKGDRVLVYMPMIPQALVSMLACSRIGAIHSVVFGGFGASELATRINHAKPKVVLAGSCGIEPSGVIPYQPLVNSAIEIASHKPEKVVYKQRPEGPAVLKPGRDLDWDDWVSSANRGHDPVEVHANDPLYILYTSGTTGAPKGVVRDNGGHAVALTWSMKNVYNINHGDCFWAASDVGWVVGHSYITYGPLLSGCSTVLYEGKPIGTPDAGEWWRVIQQYNVNALLTAPTALRAIVREDPKGEFMTKYDLTKLRAIFPAGEHFDPATAKFLARHLHHPCLDHYWQTESGWPIVANPTGMKGGAKKNKYGSACMPMPGWDLRILDESGKEVGPTERGEVALKLPLPPGALLDLYNATDVYKEKYLATFSGYYRAGDAGYRDEDGYVHIMNRVDDVINVAGHRLSTGQMEEILQTHPDVTESAVFGIKDELKGQLPFGFVVVGKHIEDKPEEFARVERECIQLVRKELGPVAAFKLCKVIYRLPKTRSGKTLRGTMSKIADGESYNVPATIDDVRTLDLVREGLEQVGVLATPERAANGSH